MQCIKAKQGYSLFESTVILKNDCYKYSSATQATIYNPYTMECVSLSFIIQGCKVYEDNLSSCVECLDGHMKTDDCNGLC